MFDFIIVVLTYKNVNDLELFIESTKNISNKSFKVIVVNSFFDDNTLNEFKRIAYKNNCDFINVQNKGYGYGNNRGIEYAKEHYTFRFLIISNPDIVIKKLDYKNLEGFEDEIVGPQIKTLKGKNQNPYYYVNKNFVQKLKYIGCKRNNKLLFYLSIIINKLNRECNLFIDRLMNKKVRRIYACHGSFVIIGHKALEKLGRIFDERIFLFSEEECLAFKAKKNGIKIYINYLIQVTHKEDGSISMENIDLSKIARESFKTYYEKLKSS